MLSYEINSLVKKMTLEGQTYIRKKQTIIIYRANTCKIENQLEFSVQIILYKIMHVSPNI